MTREQGTGNREEVLSQFYFSLLHISVFPRPPTYQKISSHYHQYIKIFDGKIKN